MATGKEFLSWAKKDARILMLGDYSTSILDRMKSTPVGKKGETFGQQPRQYGKAKFTPLDFGGRCSTREYYHYVFQNTDAMIYVVNKNENEYRIDRIRRDMHDISEEESLEGVPVLVVANMEETHSENFTELMQEKLNLNKLKGCDWHIVAASVLPSEDELQEGLKWLDRAIHEHRCKTTEKVNTDKADKRKITAEKNVFEQYAKKSLASMKKLFLIN